MYLCSKMDSIEKSEIKEEIFISESQCLEKENYSDTLQSRTSDSNAICKNKPLRESDRFLPICNIERIMKKALPKKAKISSDARKCIQECASEFISFLTSEANELSLENKRNVVSGQDILDAMGYLGFNNYIGPMRVYLDKFRDFRFTKQTYIINRNYIVYEEATSTSTISEAIEMEIETEPDIFLSETLPDMPSLD